MAKHYDKQFKLDVVQYYHEKKQSIFWENDGSHLSRSYRDGRNCP